MPARAKSGCLPAALAAVWIGAHVLGPLPARLQAADAAEQAPALSSAADAGRSDGAEAPARNRFRQDPCIRFTAPHAAELTWQTDQPSSAVVLCGPRGKPPQRYPGSAPARRHSIALAGLTRRQVYSFRIVTSIAGEEYPSDEFTFDTTFNYTVEPAAEGKTTPATAAKAAAILGASGTRRGYCVLIGDGSGRLAWELARQSELIVIVVETDPGKIAAARRRLDEAGVYGTRVSVHRIGDAGRLPLRSNFANLVVADTPQADPSELFRVLRPGSAAVFTGHGPSAVDKLPQGAERVGEMLLLRKQPRTHTGQWTHQYGTAANRASCGETLAGASGTADLELQWLGRPGGDFGLDRNPRMPAPLAFGGRLFHQGMNRIIALDAYNGAVLWNLEIPTLRRVNLPRDCGNWSSDGRWLYCAVSDQLWQIDPSDGRLEKCLTLPPAAGRQGHHWGFTACSGGLLYGTSVKAPGTYTRYWGKDEWYDGRKPSLTSMVCGDWLFALSPGEDRPVWTYRGGAIVHPTITIDRGHVYFAEGRGEKAAGSPSGRVAPGALFKNLDLVALDARTGHEAWRRKLDIPPADSVFFGQSAAAGVVLMSSGAGKYHLALFGHDDGRPIWQAAHRWPSDNHSGHMQHPVIVDGRIYLEPKGYRLADGTRIAESIGRREGCHTYLASSRALIYRGTGRQVAMWSLDKGETTYLTGLRPSCWLSFVAAEGMLLVPEGGGGCSCGRWLETSVGLAPWEIIGGGPSPSGEQP